MDANLVSGGPGSAISLRKFIHGLANAACDVLIEALDRLGPAACAESARHPDQAAYRLAVLDEVKWLTQRQFRIEVGDVDSRACKRLDQMLFNDRQFIFAS
jgi:hypothetical protein